MDSLRPLQVTRWSAPQSPGQWARISADAWRCAASASVELRLGVSSGEGTLLGAFQRAGDGERHGAAPASSFRRATGGGAVDVGEGSVYVGLSLPSPRALVPCDETRILNRHVRPLLKALTRVGATAHYFDRDWIAVGRRPAAWIGFAHDARSGATLVEAWIGLRTPFASDARATFAGKLPGAVDALAGKAVDEARLMDAVVAQCEAAYAVRAVHGEGPAVEPVAAVATVDGASARAWDAWRDEAFGVLGAGFDEGGRFRVGGELMASGDAVARLEARLQELVTADAIDEPGILRAIDDELGAPGVVVFGLRDLAHVADVVLRAARARA